MSNSIPLSVPHINGNEWKYIKECLDTGWVSSAGKYVDMFEQNIAEYTGSKYAIACVNGTSALHISLLIAGVQRDDEVIVPTLTFIAPVNVVRYCGAHPIFMDADKYYNINSEKTIDFILNETEQIKGSDGKWYSYNKKSRRRITAIIPVHVFGNAVWLDDLHTVCNQRNIKVIEDATESLGTRYTDGLYKNKHTGTVGDMGCFSFNGNKIITTGGGGMIVTDNAEYANKAKYLTTQAKDDEIRYIHNNIGYNYRLTNIQAAMGVAQLEQLSEFIKIKARNYLHYKEYINHIPGLSLAELPDYANNNYWMYVLQVDENKYCRKKDELIRYLQENGVQTRPLWYLNHLQIMFKNYYSYKISTSLDLLNNTLSIPSSPNLKDYEIHRITELLKSKLIA